MRRRFAGRVSKLALGAGSLLFVLGLPSAVFAVGLIDSEASFSHGDAFASFTPASVDPALAEMIAQRSGGKAPLMRFTPASAGEPSANRSVTVAVRVNQRVAESITRNAIDRTSEADPQPLGLRIAPTRYNLGVAVGYSSFAQTPAPVLSRSLSGAAIPDLNDFKPTRGVREEESRFAARIGLEEERPAARSSEAVDRLGDQLLDVGGSYRLTNSIDVTAGVRYEQGRELRPLPDMRQQDSQAVYIGTQFRF